MHSSTMGFKLVCLKSVNKVSTPMGKLEKWNKITKLLRLYIKDSGVYPNIRNFGWEPKLSVWPQQERRLRVPHHAVCFKHDPNQKQRRVVLSGNGSGIETHFTSRCRNRALPRLLISRNPEEKVPSSPTTGTATRVHTGIAGSRNSPRPTDCFLFPHRFTWNLLPMAIPLLPSPHLSPPSGLSSGELKDWFDRMEDWHQRRPSVTQDFSQSLVLKSMYLLKTNVGIKVVRTLWPFEIDWCLKCNSKTNLHGYSKNQAWALEVKCRFSFFFLSSPA